MGEGGRPRAVNIIKNENILKGDNNCGKIVCKISKGNRYAGIC